MAQRPLRRPARSINYYLGSRATQGPSRVRVPYSPFFLNQVNGSNVDSITSKGTAIQGTFKKPTTYDGERETTKFKTEIPAFADENQLSHLLQQKGVVVNAQPLDTGVPWWENLLLGFGPTILFVALLVLLMRRAGNVQNVLGQFGRSSARRYQPTGDKVTFEDVAGVEEAEQELIEVVDFLRHPDKYRRLGGRIPHGVLLTGPPGTGKTLLARAVAGEADAPFFSMSASEFVEAIVGVGASRVRDLFAKAKAEAPAIVFIDELDAIGRSRTSGVAGFSGGNDEREQTLNQILTEMDGFDSSTGVIVIAATNRPGDPRPGFAAARPLRPARRRSGPRPCRPRGDPEGAHPRHAARRRRRPRPHRRLDAGNGRRRPRQSRQRGGADRGSAGAHDHHRVGLHRLARAHRARRGAADHDDRGRPEANGLPRGRPRARRHAHPRRRPGAEGLDHPARHGARRHVLGAGDRPLQLRGARAQGADQGRARRPQRRGDRLRRADDGRRVGHRAADGDRPSDGRTLGDERSDRSARRHVPRTAAARTIPAAPRSPSARRS